MAYNHTVYFNRNVDFLKIKSQFDFVNAFDKVYDKYVTVIKQLSDFNKISTSLYVYLRNYYYFLKFIFALTYEMLHL